MAEEERRRGPTLNKEERKTSFSSDGSPRERLDTGGRFPGDFEVHSIFLTSPSFKDPEKD